MWIQVLLRVEPELSLARLAKELDLSDRQLGRGLSVLIREGKARVFKAPGGLSVVRVEAARRGEGPTCETPWRGILTSQRRYAEGGK